MQKRTNIVVVERTLRLLQLLADHERPFGVTEISKNIQVPKSAVHRILRTLEDFQFVIQDSDTKQYLLGPGILRLSEGVQLEPTLESIVQPQLKELARQTGEVANLGVIKNGKVFVVQSLSGRSNSRLTTSLGPIAELHCSSLGKAILAYKSKEELLALVGEKPFARFTGNTMTTIKELEGELERVRKTGVSVDNEETEEGLVCYGAAIFDWNQQAVGAISVSAPLARMVDERSEKAKKLVAQTAVNISKLVAGSKNDRR